jgi:hypothetical protein
MGLVSLVVTEFYFGSTFRFSASKKVVDLFVSVLLHGLEPVCFRFRSL